jgi:hypothetical protein
VAAEKDVRPEPVAMKPKDPPRSAIAFSAGEDEKMAKIVGEVDRFFQSVHADIEDWKFSMEDYGDGPRIFVRFQIHINKSGVSADPETSKDEGPSPGEAEDRAVALSVRDVKAQPEKREVAEDAQDSERTGAASRADLDLASFVEHWRRKRENNTGGEYHKEGAPYMDAGSEWKGQKRSGGGASPDVAHDHSDEEPRVPDAGS